LGETPEIRVWPTYRGFPSVQPWPPHFQNLSFPSGTSNAACGYDALRRDESWQIRRVDSAQIE
jgi:hypothetical protein